MYRARGGAIQCAIYFRRRLLHAVKGSPRAHSPAFHWWPVAAQPATCLSSRWWGGSADPACRGLESGRQRVVPMGYRSAYRSARSECAIGRLPGVAGNMALERHGARSAETKQRDAEVSAGRRCAGSLRYACAGQPDARVLSSVFVEGGIHDHVQRSVAQLSMGWFLKYWNWGGCKSALPACGGTAGVSSCSKIGGCCNCLRALGLAPVQVGNPGLCLSAACPEPRCPLAKVSKESA